MTNSQFYGIDHCKKNILQPEIFKLQIVVLTKIGTFIWSHNIGDQFLPAKVIGF